MGRLVVPRRATDRLQPRRSNDRARHRPRNTPRIFIAAARPAGAYSGCLAGRPPDPFPGVPRRGLASRCGVRLDAKGPRRSVRRRVLMVSRRTPRRIPQPAFRPMGRLDNGDTVNLSRAEIAEYLARRAPCARRRQVRKRLRVRASGTRASREQEAGAAGTAVRSLSRRSLRCSA